MCNINQQTGSSRDGLCPENPSQSCSCCLELQFPNSIICFAFLPHPCIDCAIIYLFLKSNGKLAESATLGYGKMWCNNPAVWGQRMMEEAEGVPLAGLMGCCHLFMPKALIFPLSTFTALRPPESVQWRGSLLQGRCCRSWWCIHSPVGEKKKEEEEVMESVHWIMSLSHLMSFSAFSLPLN